MVSPIRQVLAAFHIPEQQASLEEKGTHFELQLHGPVEVANTLFTLTFPKIVKGDFKNGELVFEHGFEPTTSEGLKVKKIGLADKEIVFHTNAWLHSTQKVDRVAFSHAFMTEPADMRVQFFQDLVEFLEGDLAMGLHPFFKELMEHYKCSRSEGTLNFIIEMKKESSVTVNEQAKITVPQVIKGVFKKDSLTFKEGHGLILNVLGIDFKVEQVSVIEKNEGQFVRIRTNSMIPSLGERDIPLLTFTGALNTFEFKNR